MTINPNDTRPTAHRLTVTPETMRQAEALGFEPGSGDVLLWALREVDRLQFAVAEFQKWSQAGPNGCPPYSSSLSGYLRQLDDSFAALRDIEDRIREGRSKAEAERDAARSALERLTSSMDANGWRQVEDACSGCRGRGRVVYGSTSTWGGGIGEHALLTLRAARDDARKERDAARRDLARIVQLCRDAVDHLEIAAIQPYGALADRLRVEAGERPAGVICGVVVSERVSGNVITRTICPLPPGHDGDHAEALAGD